MEQPRELNEEEEHPNEKAPEEKICPESHPKNQPQEGQRDEEMLKDLEDDTLGNIKNLQELKLQDQQPEDKETEELVKEKEEELKVDHQSPQQELKIQPSEEDTPQMEQLQQKSPPENQEHLTEDPKEDEAATDSSEDEQEPEPETEETRNELINQENLQKKPSEVNTKLGQEGEEDLPNEQVTQFLRHLVTQLWPELGPNPELRLERASAKGDNYLGVVWRLQVAAFESEYSLVVKLPPQNRVRRKQFFARPCFLRETAAYEVFLPLAEKLQEKWKIPEGDRFRQHARCLGTRQDEPNECIVLEDLSCSGFTLHNRFLDLPADHVRLVIRSYARLHALSLAGKRQFPERMLQLQQLVDIFEQRREDHALGVYFENLKGSALSSLTSPEDDPYRVRLEAYFSRGSYFSLLLPLVSGSNCEPFAVICHGDCWNNNILYQGEGGTGGGELKDVRLIDWQLMRYASPVTDLAYFLFTCTSRGFRQRYLTEILEEYYEELGQHLSR